MHINDLWHQDMESHNFCAKLPYQLTNHLRCPSKIIVGDASYSLASIGSTKPPRMSNWHGGRRFSVRKDRLTSAYALSHRWSPPCHSCSQTKIHRKHDLRPSPPVVVFNTHHYWSHTLDVQFRRCHSCCAQIIPPPRQALAWTYKRRNKMVKRRNERLEN